MNITKENTGELNAVIKIQLEASDYAENVNKALKKLQKTAQMPGFRKGKVPFGIVKKMYGNSVTADEVNGIVSDNLNKYIQENNIDIIGQPLPNIEATGQIDFDTMDSFEFVFDLGLAPEFNLEAFDGLKVDYNKIKVEEEIVDNYIKDAQSRLGETSYPEQMEEGDMISGEFVQVDDEGNEVEGGIKNVTSLDLDVIQLKTIKKQILALKKEENTVFDLMRAVKKVGEVAKLLNIAKEEASKIEGNYKFTVNNIIRVKHAEINEDFFKKLYPQAEIENEEQLREKIRQDAEQTYTTESDRLYLRDTLKTFNNELNLQLPDEFLKKMILSNDQAQITEEQLAEQYDSYADSMKMQLIESKIIKENDLNVTMDEVKEHIKEFISKQFPIDGDNPQAKAQLDMIVNSVLQNQEETSKIFNQLMEDKMVVFIKEKVKANEKEVSYQDFIKLVQAN